ncbi:MAG: hydroxymethylbilane synthase [Bdellovibrionales bacterium GWA2_49_15]|nr:MAG: hydroxymethylbilane synthase [Bdellovibrionales bacterium GWA2_49_15]HAZ12689.1 hydroxymethylbilane synthase [Bdellovibrionales bacterium]
MNANHKVRTYTIGSRGSLLALTQARFIKGLLESMSPHKFEFNIIKTQGDQILNLPLWQLDGKDFFTKELDDAMLAKTVDLVVHSYKDLGSDRPDGIEMGAITERAFCHDILLVKQETKQKILNAAQTEALLVGTSAPRRIHNLEKYLPNFLPRKKDGSVHVVTTKVLRGNVNTRIKKLQQGEYDAITLALAGLTRLSRDPDSAAQLKELLVGLDFMILPRSYFPGAAAQGALAIEIRKTIDAEDGGELRRLLKQLEHAETAHCVRTERKIFKAFGGGCHLAIGIFCGQVAGHDVLSVRGTHNNKIVEDFYCNSPLPKWSGKNAFIGVHAKKKDNTEATYIYDSLMQVRPGEYQLPEKAILLVASSHAAPDKSKIKPEHLLFASGAKTMMTLASLGHWVCGAADFGGEQELEALLNNSIFALLAGPKTEWPRFALTHSQSKSSFGKIIPCYDRTFQAPDAEVKVNIAKCTAFFWSSYSQYAHYLKHFPEIQNRQHFCGLGKTYAEFQNNHVTATPLTGVQEFKDWIGGTRNVDFT